MPNCFQLFKKGSTEASFLQTVDKEMCEHFQCPCDPIHWCANWYNCIGFRLACGKSFDTIRKEFTRYVAENVEKEFYVTELLVLDWLEANYTTRCWVEVGRQ